MIAVIIQLILSLVMGSGQSMTTEQSSRLNQAIISQDLAQAQVILDEIAM